MMIYTRAAIHFVIKKKLLQHVEVCPGIQMMTAMSDSMQSIRHANPLP
jgi:hypothetical protein